MKRIDQMRLRARMTVGELANEMQRTGVIGAGRVGKAVDIIVEMFSDPDFTTFISISGPLVPSGMRLIFRDLIKEGYIDAVISNGANLVHDIVESMGKSHLVGDINVDDRELLAKGFNRAYDIFIESDTWLVLEDYIGKILDDISEEGRIGTPIHRLLHEFGLRINDDDSILAIAAQKDVPIFSPGFLDSMLGIPLWMYSKRNKLNIDPIKDFDLLGELVYDAKKSGAIILGGGTPKHHTQYMNTLRDGLDAAVQISTARADDGSLSGAPLKESISWGKLKGGNAVTIFGDVTIIFPLIIAATLEKITN